MFSRSLVGISRQALRSQVRVTSNLSSCARSFSSTNLSSLSNPTTKSPQRSFFSAPVNHSAGQVDAELVNKLEAEVSYEKEARPEEEPQWLKDFKADGTFKIKEEPGSDEIVLTRKFGNESIRVAFSCSDFERGELDETDLENEEAAGKANCRIRTAISIKKPGKGGMIIDSTTDGTAFEVDNVSFYEDENLVFDDSSESDWKRRALYIGPNFVELDEELQDSFTAYMNERAVGPELAAIVLDLAEHKEQKEYVLWLSRMSKFLQS